VTTRILIKNDGTSSHKTVVQLVAGNLHFDRVTLAPGESHGLNIWANCKVEVTELPLSTSKDDVT
jgi:hypothetical protein